ncbi:hypothetical protein GWK48_01575 [Metallosphaera tengchongensis]|uniref:Uncharacterized protein n=1 Tax=Metallosphaera tengchongensis TaxID=1532350 RepID=A0A6N0NUU8_9CREN|nr:hypothetical protein [Metallosphaera tengchongensis]QKQ99257.1 hypothetical protein GWK48_01575 [Metallosphaera tengchongensis]
MVKLVNWKRATSVERKLEIARIIRTTDVDVILIPLEDRRVVEYIKSTDLDTMKPLIIRLERRIKLAKELRRLEGEGFKVKVVIPDLTSSQR